MKPDALKLVCFSPTGTTKSVLEAIGKGLNPETVEVIDGTLQEVRQQPLKLSASELLVVGVPVYMGRVPALATRWLQTIEAENTPAVCVVLYGNRVYDDALLELKDTVVACGCVPVAGAAYIGEHSFANAEEPIAEGRPNASDLEHAELFGAQIRAKLQSLSSTSQCADLHVPGNRPFGGITKLWDVDFIAVGDGCVQCGVCADVCPVGAVDEQNSDLIDVEKCITCCACIKACPQHARTIQPGPVKDAAKRLYTLFKEPKKPECFL